MQQRVVVDGRPANQGILFSRPVKYCANIECRHRRMCKAPAEFEDRVVRCSDCEQPLVDDLAIALAGVAPSILEEERGYRDPPRDDAARDREAREADARLDVRSGWAVVAGGVAVPVTTYFLESGRWLFAAALFVLGLYRVQRGHRKLDELRHGGAAKPAPASPRPQR